MRVLFCVLAVATIATVFAAETEKQDAEEIKSSQTNLEDVKIEELEDISTTSGASEPTEVTRKKKSTTTTFCVEIRPSGPFQKPFQVCEPAEPAKPASYAVPDGNYYAAPSYGGQEQPKNLEPYQPSSNPAYKPASQAKPAPAYSSPVKTFSSPSAAPTQKPFPSHPSMSYSSYRSKNAEGATQEHNHDHMMRMTQLSGEDQTSSEQMRSANYGSGNFGSANYGASTSFIPVVPKEKQKAHGHNGLVITCQPNLAGYAHNVPSSFHHPSAVSYSYRSSSPRNYGGRGYGRYRVQSQSYGNGHQAPGVGPGPVLKPFVSGSSDQISKTLPPSQSSYGPVYRNQPYERQIVPQYAPSPVFSSQGSAHSSQAISSGASYAQPPQSSFGPSPGISSGPSPTQQQHFSPSSLPQNPTSAGYGSPQSYASYSQAQSSSGQSALAPASASFAPGSASASYGPAPTGHAPASASFAPGSASASYGPAPTGHAPASASFAPGSASASYGPAPTGYAPASASFAPSPASASYGPAPTGYAPGPAPAVYGPAPTEYAPQSLPGSGAVSGPGPAVYRPAPPPPPPGAIVQPQAPPASQAPGYNPPGTFYREAEEESKMPESKVNNVAIDREGQTLKKLQEMSQQRATGTQWDSEMSTASSKQKKTDENVQATHQGWSSRSSGTSEDIEGVKQTEMEEEAKNNEIA